MIKNKRILILTAGYGDGHLQAARTLKYSFERQGVEQVLIMDLMQEAHPFINKITKNLYINSMLISQYGFDYYGWSYYVTKDAKFHVGWGRYLNNLGKSKLKETVQKLRPDAIVSTFPFGAVPELCSHLGIPTYTVITDYTLHARWIHPNIDKYYVATEDLKKQLIGNGVLMDRIKVSGIPIRRAFEEMNKDEAPSLLLNRLDPKRKTILVLAGSYGVLRSIDQMIDSLKQISGSQLAIVCGRNQKLEQKLRLKYDQEPYVNIFGFVENIHQLMAVSSCVITKAGGLTLSESLSLAVPVFIYKPFAGQEKENAVFLSGKGAVCISQGIEELACQVEGILSRPGDAMAMSRNMKLLHKKSAADSIVNDILHSINRPNLVLN